MLLGIARPFLECFAEATLDVHSRVSIEILQQEHHSEERVQDRPGQRWDGESVFKFARGEFGIGNQELNALVGVRRESHRSQQDVARWRKGVQRSRVDVSFNQIGCRGEQLVQWLAYCFKRQWKKVIHPNASAF